MRRSGAFGHHEHLQPVRPVSAEVEEVVEVREPHALQLLDEARELLVALYWPNRDELTLEAKLVRREIETVINALTREPSALEGALANDDRRSLRWQRQWHVCDPEWLVRGDSGTRSILPSPIRIPHSRGSMTILPS